MNTQPTQPYGLRFPYLPEGTILFNLLDLKTSEQYFPLHENPLLHLESTAPGFLRLDLLSPEMYIRQARRVRVQPLSDNNGLVIIINNQPPLLIEFTDQTHRNEKPTSLSRAESSGLYEYHQSKVLETKNITFGNWTELLIHENKVGKQEFRIYMGRWELRIAHPQKLTVWRDDQSVS